MASRDANEDELARTATAPPTPGTAEPRRKSAPALGEVLGRYRIERTLGEGGMGVVYAAFDPDLERRVALKVLRDEADAGESRQRLLREARAMARLTHPNVVTVHEVGSAGGRDYVAMELVEGESLADWLRGQRREPAEIMAAFVAAGRGLAAAHAAGLVHRDFKPHNVLRAKTGRICVTDFGLARGVDVAAAMSTMTLRKSPTSSENTPSPLSGLTATGSVLGTPAYMAPEQWDGGSVGPRADQFAYCVALWEALAGERPFRGPTAADLKREISRGPSSVDTGKLPRRLRPILRRGLAADPAARWPSMDALLAAIARAERRPRVALAAGSALVVAGAAVYAIAFRGGAPQGVPAAAPCAAPLLDPASVWSPARAAALAKAGQSLGADQLAADFTRWQGARDRACHADPSARAARLACLDGVLARIELSARVLEHVHDAPESELAGELVDPTVCERPRPPRLSTSTSPALVEVGVAAIENDATYLPFTAAKADALLARVAADPCASAVAHLLALGTRKVPTDQKRELDAADAAAELCGDDRLSAEVALAAASQAQGWSELDAAAKLARAEAMVAAVKQPDLEADVDGMKLAIAERDGDLDAAIRYAAAIRDAYAARGRLRAELREELNRVQLLEQRAHPADLATIATHLAQLRDRAVQRFGARDLVIRAIDFAIADWQFSTGKVDAAFELWKELASPPWPQYPFDHPVRASGRVVDEHGAPVAGATVITASGIGATALGVTYSIGQRRTTSGPDGRFAFSEAPEAGTVIAELDTRRSAGVAVGAEVTLRLVPTSRIEGTVDLRGEAATSVTVAAMDPTRIGHDVEVTAPVRADGTFVLARVPIGKIGVYASVARSYGSERSGETVTLGPAPLRGIHLVVPTTQRVVDVVVRSTAGMDLPMAEVWVLQGKHAPRTVAEMVRGASSIRQGMARPLDDTSPAALRAQAKPGDVATLLRDVPDGEVTVCAVGIPNEFSDPDLFTKANQHLDKLGVGCTSVGPNDGSALVEVPPWPRFD